MPGGSSSSVLSRIQDHNKSLDRARSSHVGDEERAHSDISSSRWKKSSTLSGLNQNSVEKRGHSSGRSPSRTSKVTS